MAEGLTLVVGGRSLTGWTRVRVTRGVERCPNDFTIGVTELSPLESGSISVQPGDACKVMLGSDLAITGFVDRFSGSLTPASHDITVSGRGKCQDLVDCAAEWPNTQFSNQTAFQLAQKLCKPFTNPGITVSCDVAGLKPTRTFNLMLGETAFEIIERVCRYSALLAYELPDGNLFLTRVGKKKHASGFKQGVNIQRAQVTFSMDERYSDYKAYLQSLDQFIDVGAGGNLQATENDPTVPRHRLRVIIAESPGSDQGLSVLKQRAAWEKGRRFGRSFAVSVTTDSWRDSAGVLWTPNQIVPLDLPLLKVGTGNTAGVEWVIGDVTYKLDEGGTTADLTLMPAAAFQPQPIVLAPVWADIPNLTGLAPQ